MFLLGLLYTAISLLAVQANDKIEAGCGCGIGPQGPLRNPNVCTPDQLKKAAIELTLKMQSYITPYDENALFALVSDQTPVYVNALSTYPTSYCCQFQETLFQYYQYAYNAGSVFSYFNPVPMGAVWNQMEGMVKVYSMETMYMGFLPYNMYHAYQVVYYWKPAYQCGTPVNSTCNLVLDRLEFRDIQCSWNEPICVPVPP